MLEFARIACGPTRRTAATLCPRSPTPLHRALRDPADADSLMRALVALPAPRKAARSGADDGGRRKGQWKGKEAKLACRRCSAWRVRVRRVGVKA